MSSNSGNALFGMGAAATLAMLVAAFEGSVEASVSGKPATRGVDPASIDRTFKGDRAPALPGASRVLPVQPASEPKLPDECVAAIEWRSNIYTDEVAGRCVA
jgi:hypothetical protein